MPTLFNDVLTTPQPWSQQVIAEWRDVFPAQHGANLDDFVVRECRRRNALMDMRSVVGQLDHYAGQSWRDAALAPQYKPGKMRAVFAQYERNPDYYFNGELDNGIVLSSIDGHDWYTDGGGNHRTVLAKFACDRIARRTGRYPLVRGVSTCRYEPDMQAWLLFCQLRQRHAQLISVAVTREDRHRADVAGATDITWRLRFFVLDRRFGGIGIPRAGHLDAACFCAYARHVLAQDGKPSWRDRVQDCLIADPDRLVYPSVA
ncbi:MULTISPECIES: hypothetical protein [unclassified Janthinobacterium]|uniref:hypothetical protein n=1 Tax=unclassified Janthinobacterium TaxID=2610881 RepID=UPI001E5F094F|nr:MULTISPECIES: hypothetical protein [unclassified Janthinobacterium]MCC7641965.1 hypothetical protein [Janthinobacterium sp. EB271-G4-3-1]MCC7690091.1 hypothetical protein [Janthinobacterium sp. EB271-G4-3-2]